MAGFKTYNEIKSYVDNSGFVEILSSSKSSFFPPVAATWVSVNLIGGFPTAGPVFVPAPGQYCYSHPSGSLTFVNNIAPLKRHILSMGCNMAPVGAPPTVNLASTLMLYDRLWCQGISLVSGTNVCGPSGLPPRYSNDKGLQAWVEVTTQTATTAPIIKLSGYTNQDGVSNQVGTNLTFPIAVTTVGYAAPLPLATGDTGVLNIWHPNDSVWYCWCGEYYDY